MESALKARAAPSSRSERRIDAKSCAKDDHAHAQFDRAKRGAAVTTVYRTAYMKEGTSTIGMKM